MKLFIKIILYLLVINSGTAYAQEQSNLFLNFLLFEGSSEYQSYSRRYFEKDTIINLTVFKKYRWESFKESINIDSVSFEYEHISKSKYILMDEKLNEVHSFNFEKTPQQGKIFYEDAAIVYDLIKGNKFPNNEESYFAKYRLKDKEYKYVVLSKDNAIVEMESNEENVRMVLEGESINMICSILDDKNFISENPSFVTPGDKIQYEVWTTTVTFGFSNELPAHKTRETYHLKDLITQEYLGDTNINGEMYSKIFTFVKQVENDKEKSIISFVNIKENVLTFLNTDGELKIEYLPLPNLTLDSNKLLFQGAKQFDLGSGSFIKYMSWSMTGYETLLSFISVFPCPMIEMWGHDNKITYLKVDGVDYGELK